MGYLLYVISKENENLNFYGTKHYGYTFELVEDGIEEFESVKYLVELGKLELYDFFNYSSDIEIELTADEFKHFIELYSKEREDLFGGYADWSGAKTLLDNPEIKELLKDKSNKILRWE